MAEENSEFCLNSTILPEIQNLTLVQLKYSNLTMLMVNIKNYAFYNMYNLTYFNILLNNFANVIKFKSDCLFRPKNR